MSIRRDEIELSKFLTNGFIFYKAICMCLFNLDNCELIDLGNSAEKLMLNIGT